MNEHILTAHYKISGSDSYLSFSIRISCGQTTKYNQSDDARMGSTWQSSRSTTRNVKLSIKEAEAEDDQMLREKRIQFAAETWTLNKKIGHATAAFEIWVFRVLE